MTSTNTDNARAILIAARLLGLTAPAAQTDIKNAFRLFAELAHPDRNPSPTAADEFRRIRFAADILTSVNLGKTPDPYKVAVMLATPEATPDPKVALAYNPQPTPKPTIDIRL